MKDCESSEITNKVFWEEYWSNIALPISVDYNFKNDRVIAEIIKKFVKKVNYDKMMVEIGCAPGKWLTLFNKELCYCVEGYEYIKTAAEKTKENLILNGIPVAQFQIYVDDFLQSSTVVLNNSSLLAKPKGQRGQMWNWGANAIGNTGDLFAAPGTTWNTLSLSTPTNISTAFNSLIAFSV